MARGTNAATASKVEEVHAPDFAKMKRIFDNDLKPADEKSAKARGDLSTAWGAIEKDCHVNKRAAKLLFRLRGESEEARDDFLRSLYGGLKALGIPVVESKGLGGDNLATLPVKPRPDPDAAEFETAEQAPAA
jgi:hypothetical protein